MASFNVDFQVKGTAEVVLPVTLLDDAIVLVNGLEQKVFRFSIENTLDRDLSFVLTTNVGGDAAGKVTITVPETLTVLVGETSVVAVEVVPTEALLDGDEVTVGIAGVEA